MPPRQPPPPPTNSVLVKIAKDIARVGWAVVGVAPTLDKPDGTAFTYTVGLYRTYDHPELVMTAIHPETAMLVLEVLVAKIKDGAKFEAGRSEALFDGQGGIFDGWFKEVLPANREEYLTIARRWNAYEEFPALQVVTPDVKNRFPWDLDYSDVAVQPLMDERVQL